jgi:hypothetical protein
LFGEEIPCLGNSIDSLSIGDDEEREEEERRRRDGGKRIMNWPALHSLMFPRRRQRSSRPNQLVLEELELYLVEAGDNRGKEGKMRRRRKVGSRFGGETFRIGRKIHL